MDKTWMDSSSLPESTINNAQKIFVTGATGFIGTRLVNSLVEQGHHVHALTRAKSNREGLFHERIKLMIGDIMDRASLRQAMDGCQRVYHLAAYAKNWAKDKSIFFQQNVDGMVNVFEAAKEIGVERIVYTSTIVVFGPTAPGVVGDESMPRITKHYYTEYEESKVAAENVALDYAKKGYPIVIVNPTRVYGSGKLTEGNSVTLMIDMYLRGKLPILLNKGRDIGNYVLVDDLVQGHILVMEKGTVGERYILGGENASLMKIFQLVDEMSGKKHFQINLPPKLAMLYSHIEKKKAEIFGWYPQITPGWVETFLHDWAYTSKKAEQELGYVVTPLRTGLRRTYNWLLNQQKGYDAQI